MACLNYINCGNLKHPTYDWCRECLVSLSMRDKFYMRGFISAPVPDGIIRSMNDKEREAYLMGVADREGTDAPD